MSMVVTSGGQSGVDAAALRAARTCGLDTGGYAPRGWLTEDGPAPWLGTDYGLTEHASSSYSARTHANVERADLVALLYAECWRNSPGTMLTRNLCRERGVECVEIEFYRVTNYGAQTSGWYCRDLRPLALADAIRRVRPGVLLVAGNRESKAPGLGAKAEALLVEVFRLLKEAHGA